MSEQDQYEKILKDYAVFLEMAEEKVNIEGITASSLEEVKKQHATHQVINFTKNIFYEHAI